MRLAVDKTPAFGKSPLMSINSFGHLFRFTTWGESHGPALGAVVDGCPPGLSLSEADLQPFLEQLKADGIEIEKTEDFDYGRFAWIKDPEGNRIELYQPLS